MYLLGYDLGSSSVKAALLDARSGKRVASASHPEQEMEIRAPRPGWAEQEPELWWTSVRQATQKLLGQASVPPRQITAIGIAYQMHGLVLVDDAGRVLRPSIIWCDSRAVEIGRRAYREIGEARCQRSLLNSPGNFTASKLRWVKENEPEIFARAHKLLLPGDYLAMRLTGRMATTVSGLSEAVLWDFERSALAEFLLQHYGIPTELVPEIVPTFGDQGGLSRAAAEELGLAEGTPLAYRAGDQPNNALSLNVLEPGEIAATAGTSGVVYAVSATAKPEARSRVNGFAHVNHLPDRTRIGMLLCVNGTGIANRWTKLLTGRSDWTYEQVNLEAGRIARGSEGVRFLPFGNGAERMLQDRDLGAQVGNLNFNMHTGAHLLRAVQEGVAFAFKYGMDILSPLGIQPTVIRAGRNNMFLSPLFRETLAGVSGVSLELYQTDGAEGAARGAGIGCGHYPTSAEAFAALERREIVEPSSEHRQEYQDLYRDWMASLNRLLS